MSGNSFGNIFKITSFGESHGEEVGVIIDGCPSELEISREEIQQELNRRRPGQSKITTPRAEKDSVKILSGIFEGKTIGTSICCTVKNEDQKSEDYSNVSDKFRPSHADFTYQKKYGIRDYRGGGRSSARETIARVMAGVFAKKYLFNHCGLKTTAFVSAVKDIEISRNLDDLNFQNIEKNSVRCPDSNLAKKMEEEILQTKKEGDSLGGVITCLVKNVPIGLGEPVFDKLEADLAKAILSIPAVKGLEIGAGFAGTKLKGSKHNDEFFAKKKEEILTKTNNSGGIQGGISNGEDIVFRVAFKPTSTILQPQKTVDKDGQNIEIKIQGRHDPCVLPRAVPIVEAMTNIVLMDHFLRNKIYQN